VTSIVGPKMRSVGIVRLRSDEPMGQELAESGLVTALTGLARGYVVSDVTVSGRRARVSAERRFPIARVQALPWKIQSLVGRFMYGRFDLVHRLDLRLPPGPAPEIITIHDIAPLRFPDEGVFPHTAARTIARADAVVCPSSFSATEISDYFGRRDVDVVPNGVDPDFFSAEPLDARARRQLDLPDRWVLHAGGVSMRKNLQSLADAWPAVHATYPEVALVLCGPEDLRRDRLFRGLPATVLLGKVPRCLLVSLMASASAVVVPSRYEGYGLPALEAMACGVPVVIANAASLPEIAGPGAILVEPSSEALAEGICRALAGVPSQLIAAAKDVARTRTWGESARQYAAIYDRVLATTA
jgi:glycosyltransferase involved in cell wall biosynthesis